jgi:septal ring factor EnvC (AmiA/AmiB activator)
MASDPTYLAKRYRKLEKEEEEARKRREKRERKEARKLMVEQKKRDEDPDSKKPRMG